MKNSLVLLMAVLMLVSVLSGCSKTDDLGQYREASSEMAESSQVAVSETSAVEVPEEYMITADNYFDYQPGYECAAFSSAYLLRHYGEEADGLELYENFPAKLPEGGVLPHGIESMFIARGYDAVFQSDGTVELLKEMVSRGTPVIVFIHVEEPYESVHNTHYIPVIGYDKDYFYFAESLEDYANCKGEKDLPYNRKIEIAKFERLWLNIDGVWDNPYFLITPKVQETTELAPEAASIQEAVKVLAALPDRVPGNRNNDKASKWLSEQYALLQLKPLSQEDYFWEYSQSKTETLPAVNNVVGYLAGSDSTRAVVVSCHFDAVAGSNGAVDNASGVAAMLCIAENLSASSSELQADYIFCAFNGEEQNYAGSAAFVEEFQGQYEAVYNVNLDCVGMIDGGAYMFGAGEAEVSYELNMAMRPYLEQYQIEYCDYPVSGVRSDHISFEEADIPNINFTQIGIQSVTHSSKDQAELLDAEQIRLLADCVTEFLRSDYQSAEE